MRLSGILLAVAVCLLVVQPAAARDCGTPNCCAKCGVVSACQPQPCKVVCDVKKVKKHRWVVEQEEFCVPEPCRARRSCNQGCGETCAPSCLVQPKPGAVRCRKKLVKEEYTVEVPIYKCVVEYSCSDCGK